MKYNPYDSIPYFTVNAPVDFPICMLPSTGGMRTAAKKLKDPEYYKKVFRLNSYKYRSDEFTKKHDGKHILFAGCSVTYGDGVWEENIWARKVYDSISETEKTSGYFNIGSNGASPIEILDLIFTYCFTFGIPDEIFVSFPEFNRDITEEALTDDLKGKEANRFIMMLGWLKLMCKHEGVGLYVMNWHYQFPERRDILAAYRAIDNYGDFTEKEIEEFMFEYDEERRHTHPRFKFFRIGFDNGHPGISPHAFWGSMMYNMYRRNRDKKD